MPGSLTVDFAPFADIAAAGPGGAEDGASLLVVFAGEDLAFGARTAQTLAPARNALERAAKASKFKGKSGSSLDLLAPQGLGWDRLVVLGCARKAEDGKAPEPPDYVAMGGMAAGKFNGAGRASVLFDLPTAPADAPGAAADFALGATLRAYKFNLYRTKKNEDADKDTSVDLTIAAADAAAARAAWPARQAIADGVVLSRNLVNEPPNVLYPEEFANRARELEALGVSVEIFDKKAMTDLGMGALLGVGQGSVRESRMVVMRWNGAKAPGEPVAFIGKGVCFDTGGISIKPAGGMEDMKGDMAGAACVVGLMHALAARKAKVNAIGAIGLVENMPDGAAQRPGDIVKSMSGQTIEIVNTDAEGRLVLADVLWYVQDKYKPKFMVDLATLTGAILVALGQEYAGLFSNNDELAARLAEAGKETGEKVWRMPLGPAYDKMIDSKFADMKNTGGRHGGSITAAQFLQRYVEKTPWAHLDIAGTGMGSPAGDINQSWGSGWGVRLLDRLVKDFYEG
ncbi:MAG: leucyl aminopeptidase [Hyphomicrobiales bacterium]|nr:leucyl aminopeptidase [Hyphomicrobiales bacterium]